MPSTIRRSLTTLLLAIALAALVLTIIEAVREHSVDPIWRAGWIPAVVAASLYASGGRRCSLHRRPR
jgi:hypothetical protein